MRMLLATSLLVATSAAGGTAAAQTPAPVPDVVVVGHGSSYRVFKDGGRTPVRDGDFYRLVGRPDLARDYQANQTRRRIAIGGGLAAVAAGGTYMLTELVATEFVDAVDHCDAWATSCHERSTGFYVAGAVAATGAVIALIAVATDPRPTDAEEARRLVPAPPRVGLAPAVTPDGGGLVLRGSF